MMKRLLLMVALVAVAACGRADSDAETALADSLSRDLELAPVDTLAELGDLPTETPATQPAPTPAPPPTRAAPEPTPTPPARDPAPTPSRSGPTISAGTVVNATAIDSLTSRHHKP
ncbi:MAG: hypothetical protein HKM89_05735, partial [Gemmatimonadales bacterium]|nr:hypothetical protein [Gemmatimonadales bacterium]